MITWRASENRSYLILLQQYETNHHNVDGIANTGITKNQRDLKQNI